MCRRRRRISHLRATYRDHAKERRTKPRGQDAASLVPMTQRVGVILLVLQTLVIICGSVMMAVPMIGVVFVVDRPSEHVRCMLDAPDVL